MSTAFAVFIGIDVTTGPKPITFVALDSTQQPLAIGEGDVHDALAYAAGQTGRALAAVNAAARPNKGLLAREEVRRSLPTPLPKNRWNQLRLVEYELLQVGIEVPETPASPDKSLPAVRRGFQLVERLETLGYTPYPGEDGPRQWLETNADADFWSLLGVAPLPAGTLEGRIQRQLVLSDEELDVPDAMEFFEEITRFKILRSNLPTKNIYSQPEINAWMAAHTAWLVANEPERVKSFGAKEEGVVFLPTQPPPTK
ncbi:MAG TPA: hypothetical protein VF806_06890 [Anaerolineaceae bacterium]